jgi:hypothetical protein
VGAVAVGVDIGQRRDPTAIAVIEEEVRRNTEIHHIARHVERLPLGTPYPAVAERVAAVVRGVHAATSGEAPTLFVDATGVGTPIVDVLRAASVGDLAQLVAVYFTHGDRRKVERGEVKLGKAWLVSRLQALLQTGSLHLPRTAEAEVLAQELLDYEIRVTEDANDRYGAFRVGTHDDLVTALGLATQEDRGGGEAATSFRDPYGWGDLPQGGSWPSW